MALRASGRAAEKNKIVGLCPGSCMAGGIIVDVSKLNEAAESMMNYVMVSKP